MVVACSSTQSCFIVTQSLCVASPLDLPQLRRFSGWIFLFFATLKKGSKRTFWVRYVLGPAFFGCSTQCRPYFCSVLRVRNSIRFGSSAFSVFLGPSFCFFDGVKNLIWGVGKKNVARVMKGLWLGTMMMGASWDTLTFQCRDTLKDIASGIRKSNNNPWTLTKCNAKTCPHDRSVFGLMSLANTLTQEPQEARENSKGALERNLVYSKKFDWTKNR